MRTWLPAMLLLVVVALPAHAAPLFNWGEQPNVIDPIDMGAGNEGVDVYPGIWSATDGLVRYFRLDLVAPPTAGVMYGFAINLIPDQPGTWIPPTDIPYGVDYGVYMSPGSPDLYGIYQGATFYAFDGIFGQTSNGGRTIEFAVNTVRWPDFAGEFRYWGGSGIPSIPLALDQTYSAATPEPAVPVLAGLGLVLLAWRRGKLPLRLRRA